MDKITTTDLMQPRYKCIAAFPDMENYQVGVGDVFGLAYFKIMGDEETLQIFYDKYPHLFKKLEWWQERKEDEMPEYVKTKFDEFKVIKLKWADGDWFGDEEKQLHAFSIFLPSTLDEYNEYQKQKV